MKNEPRHYYSTGYFSADAAYEAFWDMINEGELSYCEGKVEPYKATRKSDGKPVTRYAITTPY
jgi:hypothetical protein